MYRRRFGRRNPTPTCPYCGVGVKAGKDRCWKCKSILRSAHTEMPLFGRAAGAARGIAAHYYRNPEDGLPVVEPPAPLDVEPAPAAPAPEEEEAPAASRYRRRRYSRNPRRRFYRNPDEVAAEAEVAEEVEEVQAPPPPPPAPAPVEAAPPAARYRYRRNRSHRLHHGLHHDDSRMEMRNANLIADYAKQLADMIPHGQGLKGWMEDYLSKSAADISAIVHALKYDPRHRGNPHHSKYMAKANAINLHVYAEDLKQLLAHGAHLQDWMKSKLSRIAGRIDDVKHAAERYSEVTAHRRNPHHRSMRPRHRWGRRRGRGYRPHGLFRNPPAQTQRKTVRWRPRAKTARWKPGQKWYEAGSRRRRNAYGRSRYKRYNPMRRSYYRRNS